MRAPAQPRRRTSAGTPRSTPRSTAPAPRPQAAPLREAPARTRPATTSTQTAVRRTPEAGRRPQLSERIAERRAAARRLRWRTIGVTVAVLLVLAGLAWLIFASPVLTVRAEDIEVTGTSEYVSEARVHELLTEAQGTPVARVDTAAIAEEIRQLAAVRDVHVRRAWPNGLSVTVQARVPVAIVSDGDRYALLDAEAVVLARRDEPVPDVPEVTVPLQDPSTAESLTAVLTVLAALPEGLRAEVVSAGAETPYQVRLQLTGGAEVVWGSAEENALKVEVLRTLRQVEASTYDLSAPRSPITTE